MSIVKDSLKTALLSKPMAALLGIVLIFLIAVGYLFGYFFTYKETIVSIQPVEIYIMKAKKQTTEFNYNVYFRYQGNETTYVSQLQSCVIKPKIDDTVVKAQQVHYSYTTLFNSGENIRLMNQNELFCVQK